MTTKYEELIQQQKALIEKIESVTILLQEMTAQDFTVAIRTHRRIMNIDLAAKTKVMIHEVLSDQLRQNVSDFRKIAAKIEAVETLLSEDQPYIEKCKAAIAKATGEQ